MIGQHRLSDCVEKLIENGAFPHFSIFVGAKGSGKKTFLKEHFEGIYLEDNKVDSVRKMIEMAYKVSQETFIMPDADNMSNAAKNALLKVIEECPNDNYFIMTLEDESNTLETIRSRGTIFHMDRYTPDEIKQYSMDSYGDEKYLEEIITGICETPGEVKLLHHMGVKEFYDYVQLVVDNIAEVSLANAFKISSKVALKEDAEGYDLKLFWKAVASVMLDRAKQRGNSKELVKYCDGYSVTSRYLQKLRVKGINRSMLIDNWVLEIRDLWQSS